MRERFQLMKRKKHTKTGSSAPKVQDTKFFPSTSSAEDRISHLQRTKGNQSVQGLFKSGIIQAKLRIGQTNDIYEVEADRVAEEVMRMPEPEIQRLPGDDGDKQLLRPKLAVNPHVLPKFDLRAKEHTDKKSSIIEILDSRINSIKGVGSPLSKSEKDFFEPRFGRDLSEVRIHSDSQANHLAHLAKARAFTYGHDVVFGSGKYVPNSYSGKRLLAHELTHVIQQRANSYTMRPIVQRDVEFGEEEGSRSTGSTPGTFLVEARSSMRDVSLQARTNAAGLARQVENACEAFRIYTEPRITQLRNRVSSGQLARTLMNVALAPVGGAVTGRIVSEVGRALAGTIISNLRSSLEGRVRDAASGQRDVAALTLAVTSIAMGARDAAARMEDRVRGIIQPFCDSIIEALNSGQPILSQQERFLQTFYAGNTEAIDSGLENYGIPGPNTAGETYVQVYQALVQRFEERLIWAQASFGERARMLAAEAYGATELTAEALATERAETAAEARRGELERE